MHTIVIVDDNPGFRRTARALFAADGFSVVGEAADGHSGVEVARALAPDFVLVDVGLPDVDGFEVAGRLAAHGGAARVVLTSSREASSFGPRLRGAPVLGFVRKDELCGDTIRALVRAR